MTTPTAAKAPQMELVDIADKPAQPLTVQQPQQRDTIDSVIALAIKQNVPFDDIKQMLDLKQKWREQEREEEDRQLQRDDRAAKLAFFRAFTAFKGENIVVPKTRRVAQQKSAAKGGGAGPTFDQTEYHVVATLLQPALARHGLSTDMLPKWGLIGPPDENGNPRAWCKVACTLTHELGYSRVVELEGPPDDSGAKNPLQEMQSSTTFLMRHALLAITSTAQAGMDNDGNGARGYRDDAAAAPTVDQATLVQEAKDKAFEGLMALLEWWKHLTNPQREYLMPQFGRLKDDARAIDQRKGASVAPKGAK